MKGRNMFSTLNTKVADLALGELRDGGAEGRALKRVRVYRRDPTNETHEAALAALNACPRRGYASWPCHGSTWPTVPPLVGAEA